MTLPLLRRTWRICATKGCPRAFYGQRDVCRSCQRYGLKSERERKAARRMKP